MGSERLSRCFMLAGLLLLAACQAVAGIHERSLEDGVSEAIASVSAECKEYCSVMEQGCEGDLAQYRSTTACLVVCEYLRSFPAGKELDAGGSNTFECRNSIVQSVMEPTECDEGGPSGGGTCGTQCESYCLLRKKVCGDDFEKCMQGCPILHEASTRLSAEDAFSEGGDSLQCRFAHISAAAHSLMEGDLPGRTKHCAHSEINVLQADPVHGRPCNEEPNCDQYCQVMKRACSMNSRYAQYDDDQQCQAVCKLLKQGSKEDVQNLNTLGCRIYQAYATVSEGPEKNCSEAGPAGGGIVGCAENCLGYCTLLSRACADEFATTFGSLGKCQADCSAIDTGEPYSIANSTRPLPCRIHRAAQASALDAGPAKMQLCQQALIQSACP